ncbi:unnamed protein product [Absidia cylindrospora]
MHNLAAEHHHTLMAIQTRQAQEMEGTQSQNGSHLFVQHVEEMEIKQATFASDILQTQQSQRQEYRDFVMELYREYQMRTSALYENNNSDDNTQLNSDATGSKMEIAKSIDGKDLVTTAANRIWKKDTGSSSSSSSFSLSSSPSTTKQSYSEQQQQQQQQQQQPRRQRQDSTTSRLSQQSMTSDSWKRSSIGSSSGDDLAMQKMIQDIQEMGFTKDQAEAALTLTNGQNVERAINILVENPDQIDQQMKRRSFSQQQQHSPTSASPPPPPPQTSSSSSSLHQRQDSWNDSIPSFRRHSLQKPTPLNSSSTTSLQQHKPLPMPTVSSTTPTTTTNGGKSWNPISFFQQQKQALENTNLSSVRKFSGWLGKAMENFGIEHDENDPSAFGNSHGHGPSSQLVESFTITLGTAQIKSSHNLRLLVADLGADLLDPLPFDEQRELGYKAQTAMRLYTSQLSAILVLVDKNELCQTHDSTAAALDWRQYKMGKGSNHALYDRTLRSTEFHFPTTESQLDLIETNVQQNQKDYLQEGAFFITKHSNLPMHQIVFHLIIDGDAVSKTDLSSRHPLMIGLRNILRLTTRYDISSLSLPLVMLPDRFLDQPEHYMPATVDQPQLHVNWLSKRSEALMKTVKGYLMEASRGKQSHNEMHHRADTSAFGGSGLRNIEFFIPMQQNIYVADPLTPTCSSAPPSSTIMHQPAPAPPAPTHSSSSSSLSTLTTTASTQQQSAEPSPMTINANMTNNNNASTSLPSTPTAASHHYTRTPTPQVEQVFQQLRSSLVSIFRTS